jgi:colanic acid biosynthesis glycosyl transferase WcaI
MRLVVNDYLGHAPQVQLSRALAARGHDVLHLYSAAMQTAKADLQPRPGDAASLTIEALGAARGRSASFFAERFQEARFGRLVVRRALAFRPDVVIGCNNPLDAQRELQRACRRRNVPFVYWMQDFYAARLDRALKGRNAVLSISAGAYYHALERSLLQRSNAIIAIAPDYLGILAETWNVHDRQCMVIPNWSPIDIVKPAAKSNPWSQAQGLADRKVILYSGVLGATEDPSCVPELARNLAGRSDAIVVVVSEGDGATRVADAARSYGLSNLRVLPYQPYEGYADMLASADILLGLVSAQAGILYVPNKVSSYLCAGRPIVLSAPWQNLAAQLVRDGGGSVTPPDDPRALSETILGYLNNDELRRRAGEQARHHAERAFDISPIATRFERLFERLSTGPQRRRQRGVAPLAANG